MVELEGRTASARDGQSLYKTMRFLIVPVETADSLDRIELA